MLKYINIILLDSGKIYQFYNSNKNYKIDSNITTTYTILYYLAL